MPEEPVGYGTRDFRKDVTNKARRQTDKKSIEPEHVRKARKKIKEPKSQHHIEMHLVSLKKQLQQQKYWLERIKDSKRLCVLFLSLEEVQKEIDGLELEIEKYENLLH